MLVRQAGLVYGISMAKYKKKDLINWALDDHYVHVTLCQPEKSGGATMARSCAGYLYDGFFLGNFPAS